uniref:Peptidase M16 N-terminal domain-containing protein n=1 Tax=Rhodosorus marinus TaxID=101924 RepID=A0A7S2Z9J7_9RHOD|mmetsp:Transcript_10386/g.43204  ORF Transcript_10386/g.43204 Transcript_10386/m.43204 type:complete len:768 (+) Transcript_10386:78-2381(+)
MLTGFVLSAGCMRRFIKRSSRRGASSVDSMPQAYARGVVRAASESTRHAPSSSVPSSTVSYFKSGAKVVLFRAPGPICSATVAVATTPVSDGGHPHCLEHLIFMGSEKYPRRGFLDMLATRSYSDGTNAWTCEDHTAYTISTAGAEGLLRVLPVYLDHILNPKFDDEQFQQEVYHVRQDGEEAGVVFQEMRGRENTEGDILSSAWHRSLFKGTFLSYECGGKTENIAQLTRDEVERFHKANYRRSNMTVILVGGDDLDLPEFMSAMKPALEEGMTGSYLEISPDQRLLPSEKILLSEPLEQRKLFPAADEDVGSLTIVWHGPKLSDVRNTLAVETILRFLTENEASLLNRRFTEVVNPFCSSIDYSVELFPTTVFILGFGGIPNDDGGESLPEEGDEQHEQDGSDQMDLEEEEEEEEEFVQDRGLLEPGIMSELVMQELSSVVDNGFPGGVEAIKETILRYRRNLLLELENNVHSHVVDALIPDAVHEDGLEIGTRLRQEFEALETLLDEGEEFWKSVASQWLVKNRSRASFVGKPSRDLSTQLQRQRAESAAVRRSSMNRAKADPKPSSIDLSSVTFPNLPDATRIAKLPCTVNRIDCHSQTIQVESAFSGISIVVDTKHISKELREHLPLFCSLLFCVDVLRDDGSVEGYESFVRRLSEATIHCYAGVGRNAGTFRAGAVPSCVVIDVSTESGREAQAMEMVLQSVFRSCLSCERVSAMLSNLNSDATEAIREGDVVCRAFSVSHSCHCRLDGSTEWNRTRHSLT